MVVYYGRQVTGPEQDIAVVSSGQMRACVYDAATQNMWAFKGHAWMGRSTGTNGSVRIGVYDDDTSMAPAAREGYTNAATVSTLMTDITGGADVSATIAAADNSPTNSAIAIWKGQRYGLAVDEATANANISMRQAAYITADNKKFYDRTGMGATPPDPFGAYSASTQGHLSIWLECDLNSVPEKPTTGLAPSGTVNDLAPVFTADFRDKNAGHAGGTDRGDFMTKYQIIVERVSDNVVMWNYTNLSPAPGEKTGDAIGKLYTGSTLSRGVSYRWRCRMADWFGEWGPYSDDTLFTVANLGYVTLDSTPTGIQQVNTGITFNGKWTHQSALSTNAVQIRLKKNGVVYASSPTITKTVVSSASPGTAFTITWAESTFANLPWGTAFTYEIRGRDTGNQWSDWSAGRSFSTESAPSVPANLTPNGNQLIPSIASTKVQCTVADVDDTSATGLAVDLEITRPDLSTTTVAMTYNGTTGKWEFQLTATQINQYGTYSMRARSFDGTLYSGETTVAGSATWSNPVTFRYLAGPTVTVTAPTDGATIAAGTYQVQWTAAGQVKYQVKLYEDGTSTVAYDSGLITSGNQFHDLPAGAYHNNTAYDLVVEVTDANPLVGSSGIVNITVNYGIADVVQAVLIDTIALGHDPWPTAISISFDQTEYAAPDFQEYTIVRSASGGPDAAPVTFHITNPEQRTFVDIFPASGFVYTYDISQTILVGTDYLTSFPVTVQAQVDLYGLVVALVPDAETGDDPTAHRFVLPLMKEHKEKPNVDDVFFTPISGARPVSLGTDTNYWTTDGTYPLVTHWAATAQQQKDDVLAVQARRSGIACIRDDRGTKRFVTVNALEVTHKPGRYDVAMSTREEDYTEGAV